MRTHTVQMCDTHRQPAVIEHEARSQWGPVTACPVSIIKSNPRRCHDSNTQCHSAHRHRCGCIICMQISHELFVQFWHARPGPVWRKSSHWVPSNALLTVSHKTTIKRDNLRLFRCVHYLLIKRKTNDEKTIHVRVRFMVLTPVLPTHEHPFVFSLVAIMKILMRQLVHKEHLHLLLDIYATVGRAQF